MAGREIIRDRNSIETEPWDCLCPRRPREVGDLVPQCGWGIQGIRKMKLALQCAVTTLCPVPCRKQSRRRRKDWSWRAILWSGPSQTWYDSSSWRTVHPWPRSFRSRYSGLLCCQYCFLDPRSRLSVSVYLYISVFTCMHLHALVCVHICAYGYEAQRTPQGVIPQTMPPFWDKFTHWPGTHLAV